VSTKIQHVGGASASAGNPSLAVTIAATKPNSALVVVAYINSGGTAGISGAGGSWSLVLNDTTNKVYAWVNLTPTQDSTSVTVSSSVNTHFTVGVIEQAGLKPGGLSFAAAVKNNTAVTAWTSNTVANGVPVFAVGIAQQGTNGTNESTAGVGYSATSGTGITNSTVKNGTEGDTLGLHVGEFGQGTLQGAGTWGSATNCETYVVGFELLAVPTVFAPPKQPTGQRLPGSALGVMRAFFQPVYSLDVAAVAGSTGTLATTNADDTSAAAGTTTVVGTLAKTNANDTSSAAGTTTVLGTLARTNANDTSSAAGTTTVLGTLARTNANDSSAASGTTTVTGSLATTNANDTLAASGELPATGTANCTNNDDTCSASGETPGGRSGVPGHRHRYIAYINGQQYVGPLEYIETVVREYAEQQAKKAVQPEKKPKKARIVVQPGRKVDNAPAVTEEIALTVQKSVRDTYSEAYALALNRLRELEDDEDETLLMLI